MDLSDSPGEAVFRERARTWIRENRVVAPSLTGAQEGPEVDAWRLWSRRLHEAGFAGLSWPIADGGQGLSPSYQVIWLQEIARAGVPDHIGVIGLGMAGPTIAACGTPEQRRRFLPPILQGAEIWCQGFSEPGSGSDLASITTRAVLDGDTWVVNGQKVWSSFAHWARWCLLLVRSENGRPDHHALTCLLLDLTSPGVDVRPIRQLTGEPEFNEIFLTNVRVPVELTLGERGAGWSVAVTTLSHERGTHGAGLAAQLGADYRAAVSLLACPDATGRRPLDSDDVRDQLAELWIEISAVQMANLRALHEQSITGVPGPGSTIAKLCWSEVSQALARLVVHELGPGGLREGPEAPAAGEWAFRLLRTRGNSIEAGTSEVLRNIIAERVLGLPRSR